MRNVQSARSTVIVIISIVNSASKLVVVVVVLNEYYNEHIFMDFYICFNPVFSVSA